MTENEIDDLLDLGIEEEETPVQEVQEVKTEIEAEIVEDTTNFDEVLEGFQSLAEEIETNPTDIAKASKKFDSLSEAFGVSSEAMEEELDEMISEAKGEIVEHVKGGFPVTDDIKASAFNVDGLGSDFVKMRRILLDSLDDSRAIQKKFTDEMLMTTIDDIPSTTLMGYSELMKAVTRQAEVLAKIYKDVAETQVKLKAYLREEQAVKDQEGPGGTTNIQNNYILSTKDLIDKFNPS